ncbi:hypothetical protein B296_00019763 [Ensete ventricosum]|uniref:Uncharacterized protein n=1 Tax=Ensete ventricosum TaxID=4639 RepID=A0A426XJS6_ENSVE|nr:hypothetical protein B296_00019763 [Ensete ventricosum]
MEPPPDPRCDSRADSQPLLEDDDRPGVPLTRIQPHAVHGHGRGFPRPHQPSPSTSGDGADHNLIPTPARAFDGSPIGSPSGTPESPAAPNQGILPDVEPPQPQVVKARTASSTPTPAQSQSRSYNPVPIDPDLDTLSTDTADSLKEQVRRVHQRLDEVQKEVLKSRGEVKPLPATFRLPALEPYDGSGDPIEHIAAFRTQMALYDTSDALMWNPRPPSIPSHPSILDGAETVKVLLVTDRVTTGNSARDAATGTLVHGGQDTNSWQAGRDKAPPGGTVLWTSDATSKEEGRQVGLVASQTTPDSPQFNPNRDLLPNTGKEALEGPKSDEVAPRAVRQKKVLPLSQGIRTRHRGMS